MKDYYKILQISKDSSQEEIKRKYRELAKRWHPDANGNSREAEEKFKDIAEAYAVLSSPVKRKEYDDSTIFQNSYRRRTEHPYGQARWQTEEDTPFYTFYYTSSKNKNKKKKNNGGDILKGILQIVIGISLFSFSGLFLFLGIYAVFSGAINIMRAIK